jgi:hypothetical protein
VLVLGAACLGEILGEDVEASGEEGGGPDVVVAVAMGCSWRKRTTSSSGSGQPWSEREKGGRMQRQRSGAMLLSWRARRVLPVPLDWTTGCPSSKARACR